jgi:hypothetical protein
MTDPFQEPADKGALPYWERPREPATEAKQMRLIRWMELARKEEAEACRMAKPGEGI